MGFLLIVISILKIVRFVSQSTFEDVELSEEIDFVVVFSDVDDLILFGKYAILQITIESS